MCCADYTLEHTALDDVVLTCLTNAGHVGSSALGRLAVAKRRATIPLAIRYQQRHRKQGQEQQRLDYTPPATRSSKSRSFSLKAPLDLPLGCLDWGLSLDLAVVALPRTSISDNKDYFSSSEAKNSGSDNTAGVVGSKGMQSQGQSSADNDLWSVSSDGCCCLFPSNVPVVLDSYGAKVACFERAVGLAGLLHGTDGILLT